MKGPTEEGYSLAWHSLLPWFEMHSPQPAAARATLGRFMRDYGRDQVLLAFDRTLEAKPRPVDPFTYFAKLCASTKHQLGDAQSAWNTVMRLSSNCDTAASYASPQINSAIGKIGGWRAIGQASAKTQYAYRELFFEQFKLSGEAGL